MRLVFISMCLMISLFIQAQQFVVPNQTSERATVYFYRLPNYVASGVRMKILANNEPVTLLRNGSYYQYSVFPGEYTFACKMGSEAKVKLTLEPARSYYIKGYLNMGFWSSIPILEVVDSISGQAVINGGNLRPLMNESISTERPKSRLGISLGGGFGFESVDLFIDEDGNDVTLSTGGGFAVGAEYGRAISKHFDLSLSCYYQQSSLSRALKNASGTFEHMTIFLTPALVIPIKGGDYARFRLGAGPGFFILGDMDIDASKVGASTYKYKYDPAFGFQGSFFFNSNYSDRGAFNLGIRFYSVKYNYNPEKSTHNAADPRISNPSGSGLDFIVGHSFLF